MTKKKKAQSQRSAQSRARRRTTPPRRTRSRLDLNLAEAVGQLGEEVALTWFRNAGGHNIHIPLGVVASLSLVAQKEESGPDLADQIFGLEGAELIHFYRHIWSTIWWKQPYLVEAARPIHDWLNQKEDPETYIIGAITEVTRTAINHGQLEITGSKHPDQRSEIDLLSRVLTELRSANATKAQAEIHTPHDVAEAMARVMLIEVNAENFPPGKSICDPAVGSGTLLRAAAQHLRDCGLDPRDYTWVGIDKDPLAAATFATNAMVWGLGPSVIATCGDSLMDPQCVDRAIEERRKIHEHRDRIRDQLGFAMAARKAITLLNEMTSQKGAA